MPLNQLRDWDTSGRLSPSPNVQMPEDNEGLYKVINMLQGIMQQSQAGRQKQQQDMALRQAAASELGMKDLPSGVMTQELFGDMLRDKSKNQTPYANDPLKQMEFENVMKGFRDKTQPSVPDSLGQAVTPQNPGAAVLGAGQETAPSQFGYFGKLDPKYGTPVQTENPDYISDQVAKTAAEKERQLNVSKVGRLGDMSNILEKRFAETNPQSGIMGPISGMIDVALKGLQSTPNQVNDRAYVSFVKGFRAQLARAMGDVGNLSEPEQKAAMNLVPNMLDSKETAAKKLSNLRDLISTIQTRPKSVNSGVSQPQGNKVGKYTRVE